MNIKEFLKKQITEKRNQTTNLEKALIESDDKEERAKLGDTLAKLRDELNEAEKALEEVESKEKEQEEKLDEENQEEQKEARNKALEIRSSYFMNGGKDMESRKAEMDKVLEARGKALKEKRAITVETGKALLPVYTGDQLNDTFTPVSTLVDKVATEQLMGGESYKEAFVKSYGTGGITAEGTDYTEAEPVFEYAPMNKVKITAYAELSEEIKKLTNIDYASKVQDACLVALKKKLSQQVIAGTGTDQLVGVFASPVAIDASKDIELEAIDNKTLDSVVFSFGGDEDVESNGTLILNKKTLKALSEVRTDKGDKVYDIDVKNKTINTIPYVINSNVEAFETATADKYVMAFGDLNAYKVPQFSDVEIVESTDFKFKQGMICFKASGFFAGNVIKQDGFLRVKKKVA